MGGPQLPPLGYAGAPVSGQSQSGYGAPSPAVPDGMHKYVPIRLESNGADPSRIISILWMPEDPFERE